MKIKFQITIGLLFATIFISFALPKPQYESPDIIGLLDIPKSMRDWRSEDMSDEIKLKQDDRYKFISEIFARRYYNSYGESLLFLILDAGNFHHPKVCFGSSGFVVWEMDDTELSTGKKIFKAKTLLMKKGSGGFVIIYWMVINKKQITWTEQKFQQLWSQLFNKEKIGVMSRLDIPIEGDNVQLAVNLAQKFIRDITRNVSENDAEYMFGK